MGKVPPLSCSREGFQEGVHGRPNAPPCLNGAGGDTPATGGGVSEEFVMLPMKGGGARCGGGKPNTVGGHWVPYCRIKQEFSRIERMRGYDIKDALLHLCVFTGTEASWFFITRPGPNELGYDHFQPCVESGLSAEDRKKMSNGLMYAIDTTSLLTHEKLVWSPDKVSIADWVDTYRHFRSSSRGIVLAFACSAGNINP